MVEASRTGSNIEATHRSSLNGLAVERAVHGVRTANAWSLRADWQVRLKLTRALRRSLVQKSGWLARRLRVRRSHTGLGLWSFPTVSANLARGSLGTR